MKLFRAGLGRDVDTCSQISHTGPTELAPVMDNEQLCELDSGAHGKSNGELSCIPYVHRTSST